MNDQSIAPWYQYVLVPGEIGRLWSLTSLVKILRLMAIANGHDFRDERPFFLYRFGKKDPKWPLMG